MQVKKHVNRTSKTTETAMRALSRTVNASLKKYKNGAGSGSGSGSISYSMPVMSSVFPNWTERIFSCLCSVLRIVIITGTVC